MYLIEPAKYAIRKINKDTTPNIILVNFKMKHAQASIIWIALIYYEKGETIFSLLGVTTINDHEKNNFLY